MRCLKYKCIYWQTSSNVSCTVILRSLNPLPWKQYPWRRDTSCTKRIAHIMTFANISTLRGCQELQRLKINHVLNQSRLHWRDSLNRKEVSVIIGWLVRQLRSSCWERWHNRQTCQSDKVGLGVAKSLDGNTSLARLPVTAKPHSSSQAIVCCWDKEQK